VRYLDELDVTECASGENTGLTAEEEVLMKILRQYIRTTPINPPV
jgi:hypothetical protein